MKIVGYIDDNVSGLLKYIENNDLDGFIDYIEREGIDFNSLHKYDYVNIFYVIMLRSSIDIFRYIIENKLSYNVLHIVIKELVQQGNYEIFKMFVDFASDMIDFRYDNNYYFTYVFYASSMFDNSVEYYRIMLLLVQKVDVIVLVTEPMLENDTLYRSLKKVTGLKDKKDIIKYIDLL